MGTVDRVAVQCRKCHSPARRPGDRESRNPGEGNSTCRTRVGCVEAPRGSLIHDYTTDENGIITNVNLIVGTTHNNAPINMSVKQAAKASIKDGKYDQGILNRVEMAIRAYDPCLSCATHKFDGTIAVKLRIYNAKGDLVETLSN